MPVCPILYGITGGDVLGDLCLVRGNGGQFLRSAQGDVDEQGAYDGSAHPHGLLPSVDEGLLGGVDQVLRAGACAGRGFQGVGDAVARGVRGALGDALKLAVDGAVVAGR